MKLDTNGLARAPIHARIYNRASQIEPNWWWYEDRRGIELFHCLEGTGKVFNAVIPAHQLRAYLKRLDAGKGKKR